MDNENPKRRKSKDNPYTIYKENNQLFVNFKDGENVEYTIEVDVPVFALFNSFELEDLSQMNEYDRHIEHSRLNTNTLHKRSVTEVASVDECAMINIRNEKLRKVIDKLPSVQRRRLLLYYYKDMTYDEIAEIEGCTKRSVYIAIERGKEKLKKILKNF